MAKPCPVKSVKNIGNIVRRNFKEIEEISFVIV